MASSQGPQKGAWQSLGVDPIIAKALTQRGFKSPTPIQRSAIPLLIGPPPRDVLGMARTGSGKTFAYIVPLLQRLIIAKGGQRGLILIPTRELALQVLIAGKDLSRGVKIGGDGERRGLRWGLIMGGDALDKQFAMMESRPDILITTPGRLLHLLVEMDLDLREFGSVVYDEADRLFEMGFQVQLHEILARLPSSRHSMLFSATLPTSVAEFAQAGLSNPAIVRLDAEYRINPDLAMQMLRINGTDKAAALLVLLSDFLHVSVGTPSDGQPQVIVFVATKHHVEYITTLLQTANYAVSYVYGNLDQVARQSQMREFRDRLSSVLVVTDVAARGLDIPMIDHVINYDFPPNARTFVHRAGRTARGGRSGTAWSLVEKDDLPYYCDLNAFLQTADQETTLQTLPASHLASMAEYITAIGDSTDLVNLRAVMHRGDAMYRRSRRKASAGAYKDARALSGTLIAIGAAKESTASDEADRQDLLSTLESFRPATPAVLPKAVTRKAVKLPSSSAATQTLPAKQSTQSHPMSSSSKDFRDEAFFIPEKRVVSAGAVEYSLASSEHNGGGEAAMAGDETQRYRPQKASQLSWDRKRRNFTQAKESSVKMIKTESGNLLPATYKSGTYRSWQQGRRPTGSSHPFGRGGKLNNEGKPDVSSGLGSARAVHKQRQGVFHRKEKNARPRSRT